MQQLQVNLSVNIPEHLVLIEKVEYQQLKDNTLQGVYWTMKDLEIRTGMKSQWLKENVLYKPKFKKQLDLFTYYPNSQGEKWSFHARKMAQFLDENFYQIFNP